MEVANDKIVAPSLFDLLPPRASGESAPGPSFRDCLQTNAPPVPSPAPADSPRRDERHAPAAERKPSETEADNRSNATSRSDESHSTATEQPQVSSQDHGEQDDNSADDASLAAEEAAAAAAIVVPLPDDSAVMKLAKDRLSAVSADLPAGQNPAAKKLEEAPLQATGTAAGDLNQLVEPAKGSSPTDENTSIAPNVVVDEAIVEVPAEAAVQPEGDPTQRTKAKPAAERPVHGAGSNQAVDAVEEAPTESKEVETKASAASEEKDQVPVRRDDVAPASVGDGEKAGERVVVDGSQSVAETANSNASSVTDSPVAPAPTQGESASVGPARDAPPPVQAAHNEVASANVTTPKPPASLLKSKMAPTESTSRAGEIDPAKFLHRVAKAFESAQQRDSEVRLRLHPAELGSLSVEIQVQDGMLSARLQVETSEARTALVDNLPALRERLAEQGIRIEKFDVDLRDHSDRQQQSLREQAQERETQREHSSRAPSRRAATEREPPTASNRSAGPGGLNVVI